MKNDKLLNEYKSGKISLDEYILTLREQNANVTKHNNHKFKHKMVDLDKALADKLDKEYKDFCRKIMTKDKKEIFDRAYEITVKDELKEELKNMELYDAEKEMIILQDDVLNEFYKDWLDCDVPLGDVLRENLEESVATLTRYMGKRINRNFNNER